jgi:CheY-like chemotaxis protein
MERVIPDSISLQDRNAQWLRKHSGESTAGQPILIAEDSESDIFFLLRVMQQAGVVNPIFVVRDGTEALAYLKGTGKYADRAQYPVPGIVFLDLRLPEIDGFEILRATRGQRRARETLMVAVSSYDGIYSINVAYESGADTFLSKPLDANDVLNLIHSFEEYWELVHSRADQPASVPQR